MPLNTTHLPRLASLVFNRPHYITPQAAQAVVRALDGRITIGGVSEITPTPQMNRFAGDDGFDRTDTGGLVQRGYQLTDSGTAIISVVGELVNRGAWLGADSGLVSYEGLRESLRRAAIDDRVNSIILDMDSPGGQASGMSETANLVSVVNSVKPVVAVVNDMAASAGYGIASGATRIVSTDFGTTGSIGVVLLHADYSKKLEQDGVAVTMIHAGAHKVDGNPFEPLPDEVRSDFESEVTRFYDDFVSVVARNRASLSEQAIRATEARVYRGRDAIAVGLIDAIGSFDDVLDDLKNLTAGPLVSVAPQTQEREMTVNDNSSQAAIANVQKVQQEAEATAALLIEKGAKAERERILGIEALAMPGHETLLQSMKEDGQTTPAEAAVKLLQAEKAANAGRLQSLEEAETEKAGLASSVEPDGHASPPAANADTPDGWRSEYSASDDLQAEFRNVETYVAFKEAEKAGRARRLTNAGR